MVVVGVRLLFFEPEFPKLSESSTLSTPFSCSIPGVGGVVDSLELLRNNVSTGIFWDEEKLRLKRENSSF